MRRIAALLVVFLTFAQIVTAAHACSIVVPISQSRTTSAGADESLHARCHVDQRHAPTADDVCASHCAGPEQADTQLDASPVRVAPHAALTVRTVDACATVAAVVDRVAFTEARSRPLLLFGRLLI